MFSLQGIESQHHLRWCWSIWTKPFNTTIFLDKYCEKLVLSFCSKPILVSIMQLGMLRYLLVCTWFWSIQGANILFIHPLFAGSHLGLLRTIGEHLMSRGHNVTIISFKQVNTPLKNSTTHQIQIPILDKRQVCGNYINEKGEFDINLKLARSLWETGAFMSFQTADLGCTAFCHCDTLFESQRLKELMASVTFDLVLLDLKGNECGFKWISFYDIPTVAFWGLSFVSGNANVMRAGPNPFQAPQILSRSGQAMGLLSLMWNFYLFCFDYILVRYVQYGIPDMYSIDKRPGPGNQWMEELYDNLDMIFVASGPLFETPRQVAPIVKQIPGLTIKPPTLLNSSSSEINDFLEKSTQGVVLFSLGQTGVGNGDYISQEFKQKLINAMLRTPYNAIMHLDPNLIDSSLKESNRLYFDKWLPNQEILAHRNTRVFLSHVGLASVQEAMFHQVPILAMPTFEDQFEIAKTIEDRQIGDVIWDKMAIKSVEIANKLVEVATNTKYRSNMKHHSRLFRALLEHSPPLNEITFWIEVILEQGSMNPIKMRNTPLNFLIDCLFFTCLIALLLIGYVLSRYILSIIKPGFI